MKEGKGGVGKKVGKGWRKDRRGQQGGGGGVGEEAKMTNA